MGKVAIVTLNGYFNYGNRLQNYAVQEVLKSYGFEVETLIININNTNKKVNNNRLKRKMKNLKGKSLKDIYIQAERRLWSSFNKNEISESKLIRTEIFKKFTKDYINETNFLFTGNSINESIVDKYDYFVTGSDQVWNPDYISGSSIYFLTFAPVEKRISFSPSFGVSEIPLENQEDYKKWIYEMKHLSVREEAGAKIIKKLTGRDALVLLDPTMMITKKQWLSIANKPSNISAKKYLLTYFLGNISDEYNKKIKKIARENDLKIINLANIRDKESYRTGPSEFIYYINSASVFCTDSFHGAVFSILLETPFIVFERKDGNPSMYSRIDTLLNTFKLTSRKVNNISTNEQIFNVNFSHVSEILDKERNKTFNYLSKSLNIEETS